MVEKDGKIIEVTTTELFSLYLRREMDLIMSFSEYVAAMEHAGCKVKKVNSESLQ